MIWSNPGEAPCCKERAELRAENERLRRWKALDKPVTAAMEIANSHLATMRAENKRLHAAIAYVRQRSARACEILNEFDATYEQNQTEEK